MIRYANINDKDIGIKLLSDHIKEFDFAKDWNQNCEEYYNELLKGLIQDKTIIISENNNKIDGALICAKVPNILNPYITQLQVLVTWVRKDKRGSSIFYRMNSFLEKEFDKYDIVRYHMPNITNVDFTKLGYYKISEMYIKEGK